MRSPGAQSAARVYPSHVTRGLSWWRSMVRTAKRSRPEKNVVATSSQRAGSPTPSSLWRTTSRMNTATTSSHSRIRASHDERLEPPVVLSNSAFDSQTLRMYAHCGSRRALRRRRRSSLRTSSSRGRHSVDLPEAHQYPVPVVDSLHLGGSEFYRDDPSDAHYWHARVLLMEAVSEVCPDLIADLGDRALSICNAVRDDRRLHEPHLASWKSVSSATPTHRAYLLPLRTAIQEFATDHHLDAEWSCEIFLRTVFQRSLMVAGGAPTSSLPPHWPYPPASARFPFSEGEKLDRQVTKRKRKAAGRFAKLAESRGFRRSRRKHDTTHFRWLARYQVLGWSFDRIAAEDEQKAARKTVSEAVHRTAALLPLDLRPTGKPGRPRTPT